MVIVDLFKQFTPQQEGKVYMKQDRYLKKRILYLDGNINTVAQINIAVNLRMNYLHFQVQVPAAGVIMISLNYQNKGQNFKVCISNLFKSVAFPHENQINHPCPGMPNWGTIVIDLKSFYSFTEITQLNISGNVSVKGIYNTNEEQLLPTEFQLNSVHRVLIKYIKPKLAPLKSILRNKGKKQELAPLEEIPLPQERVSPMKQEIIEEQPQPEKAKESKPLMKLKHIHGYTPKNQANILFLDDNYFAFPCNKTIVIMSEKEQKFCSATSEIQSISKNKNLLIAACESEILTFDYTTCQKMSHYKLEGFKTKFIQYFEDSLMVLANDEKHQVLLIIRNEVIAYKQASPFHITTFRIWDRENFVTVGKENLRFWHVKEACLQGHSPFLGQYARETDFTDLLIQEKRVLACCKRGRVFQFIDKELSGVWQISESPITTMNKFTQYVITTHKDGIKCWKPDFSELVREIKSEVEVIGCDSRTKLLCAFRDKSIGIADDKTIKFLVHSHQQAILDLIQVGEKIISSAMDHEIRIWNNNLSLEYQFRCLDGLANCLCGMQTKQQFIAGFDNGFIRTFDLQTYQVILEIDTKHPILSMSGNSNDTLFLITHESDTLVLNNKLLIIKQHYVKCNVNDQPFALNGFFNEMYYIASSSQIKLFSCDHLSEKYHLNIPITSIDCNDDHLHIVSNGNIKRFDKQLNFLQELISNSLYVKSCNNFVFSANSKDQLIVFDYLFQSDESGNPNKQIYQQKVKKLIISNQIVSFVDDFIFIWDTNGVHNSMLTHDIDKGFINQGIEIVQEQISPHKQKLEKEKQKDGKENKKSKKDKNQPQHYQQPQPIQSPQNKVVSPKESPKAQLPEQHLNIQNQNKQLIIDEQQLPKIKIQKVMGYRFADQFIQQFPWNKQEQFYLLPSERFLVANYYAKHKQQLILTNEIQAVHYSSKGIIVILKSQVLVFDLKMDLIKQFDYAGNLVCSSISPCGNYLLMINDNKIQIYILSSGRILTQTVIQYGSGNIYTDWCHDQDLMFVTLSGIQNQLWRVNQKALLEYCDLDIQPQYYQSSGYYQQSLIVSQGQTIHHIDIKQARTIVSIENATSQDITQVVCTQSRVILFTNSPNIYLYSYKFDDKQIISLDSIPVGYSNVIENDIIVVTRSQVWFVDLGHRTTVKIEPNMPIEHKVLCTNQDIFGTSEGQLLINNDEIFVPKRQCLQIQSYKNCLIVGYSDGYCRLFKDFKLIGQIQVGKCVTALISEQKNYFIAANEIGQLYYCTRLNEIKMHEITQERGDFAIISLDFKEKLIAYSTANQKVQILHYKEKEEFIIKKGSVQIDETPEYYLIDSYRFRSIEPCSIQFNKTNPEQIIMLCNQIVIRNYIEHLNIITIECNGICFMQLNQYLIIGRKDGSISMYDNEIELDKVNLTTFPIHMMNNNYIAYGNMVCQLIQ